MNQRAPYDFITDKLEQFPAAHSHELWEQMQQRLDVAMPVKENDRRRYILYLLAASVMIIICASVIYLYQVRIGDYTSVTNNTAIISTSNKQLNNSDNTPSTRVIQSHNNIELNKVASTNTSKQEHTNLSLLKTRKTSSISLSNQLSYSRNRKQNQQLTPIQKRATVFLVTATPVLASDYFISDNDQSTSTEKQLQDINTLSHTVPAPEKLSTESSTRITQIDQQHLHLFIYKGLDSVLEHSLVTTIAKSKERTHSKGWVVGVAMNLHLPVSHQEMSTVNMNGKQNSLFDYLPSIYVQYHFSGKWYLSSELGWINPQYTPNLSLFDHYTKVNNWQKQEVEVSLNKLYYLNIPVSMHYRVAPHLYLGGGIEYSYLKRSILNNEQCMWEQQGSNWVMTNETKSVSVNANPHAVAKKNNGNPSNMQPVDSIAQSFRSSDWRVLMDVNYQYHRFVLGMNFAMGLTPYIKVQAGSGSGDIKDRNEAIQLYLHYNLFDKRK